MSSSQIASQDQEVALNDVQGIIIKGYKKLPHGLYLLFHMKDGAKAKQWLGKMATTVNAASTSTDTIDTAVNLALSNHGVRQLGFSKELMNTFPRQFEEGMTASHRQRILGDFDKSDPTEWDWGGPNDEGEKVVHGVLLIYSRTEEVLKKAIEDLEKTMSQYDVCTVKELPATGLHEGKEHFGFRDGLANPVMKNAGRWENKEHEANLIKPGEFIFGYANEYDEYALSPNVPTNMGDTNLLDPDKNYPDRKDLGKNGSMLVFRQMTQNVKAFWDFVNQATQNEPQPDEGMPSPMVHLASKMVGRWPNGSPLAKCPVAPDEKYRNFDNFGYGEKDYDGLKCPMGSHVRRTNPRDSLTRETTNSKEKDREKSGKFMKRFRILRRGRPYGDPLTPELDPHDMLNAPDDGKDRGLHFICFNTNIARQFELIQQTWVNNPKFAGLYEDPDPIIGYPGIMGKGATTTFTEPADPVRKKVHGVPRFVDIKGGAYFFLPGIKALRFLATV